mmetsp:Transcript_18304/g.36854  ORF Transcript_18304/g.36854 Transcript_18304/m.36854 type:complete len:80 (-) Transcript_18304:587-826(-)
MHGCSSLSSCLKGERTRARCHTCLARYREVQHRRGFENCMKQWPTSLLSQVKCQFGERESIFHGADDVLKATGNQRTGL